MEKEDLLFEFRSLINEFKTPFLSALEERAIKKEEDIQDVDQINGVLEQLDKLYTTIKKIIIGKGISNASPEENLILSIFEKKGLVDALKSDSSLKQDFMYYLNLDLRTYPFTRSTGHLRKLETNNIESFQREIVQNLE